MRSLLLALLLAGVCLSAGPASELIDSPMYRNPDLPAPPVEIVIPEGAKEQWLRALERPEVDYRSRAADAIARAHRLGVEGMDTTAGPLRTALDKADEHPSVRLALARTLIALGSRDAADSLLRAARSGPREMRELIDPALASWDHRPARELWLERLGDPAASVRTRIAATQCLGVVKEESAAGPLRELVLSDRTAAPLRVAAAGVLGTLRAEGLEADAERLAGDAKAFGIPARLAAASLLRRHEGETAVKLLKRLTRDTEPAVGAVALGRLIEIDPNHAVPDLDFILASADPKMRALGVLVLFWQPSEKHVRLMGDRLDDVDPGVREAARAKLQDLGGKQEWRSGVIAEGVRLLAGPSWRGQEQAAILLARLDHKPAGKRLTELLTADRPEAFVTAAWALRILGPPETLPAVTSYVDAELGRALKATSLPGRKEVPLSWADHQLSQLNQLLGEQKYAAADSVLRKFVPKSMLGVTGESRAAAVWALGLIHEGKSVPALASALEGRLNDVASIPPEDMRVRRMAAILLGRVNAKDAVPSLRKFYTSKELSEDPVNNACGWAIERLTGEKVPAPKPIRRMQRDWFLSPIN